MSGIQNQADKHIFSSVPKCQASLKYKVVGNILEIVCNIFATFYFECSSRYSNPIHMFGAKMLVWETGNKSSFENEVKKPKNTHSNASVLHMTNIKINFHKKIFEWIEASKTGTPQILCEIEINKEDAP